MKEKRLKRELRLLGLSPKSAAKKLGVSEQTINNYICARSPIKACIVAKLRKWGITKKAILNPSEEV